MPALFSEMLQPKLIHPKTGKMKKYTFLGKNPRFCMQDRKITIANTADTCTEHYTLNSIIQFNEKDTEEPQIYNAETWAAQNQVALCRIPQYNTQLYHYKHYKQL